MYEFYKTTMGARFFEKTMPGLVAQLQKLNDNLERIARVLESKPTSNAPEEARTDANQDHQ